MTEIIDKTCPDYNLGGNGILERHYYPQDLGARCEQKNTFFVKGGKDNILTPNCEECPTYLFRHKNELNNSADKGGN